jgi:DNA-binding SARP family transcriptional activator
VSPSPPFRLRLLDLPTRVEDVSAAPVELAAGKPLALLTFLHLADAPVPRDALAARFWPDASHDRARGSVRHALWTLRQRLSDDLFAEDDPVRIRRGLLSSDVTELLSDLEAGDIEAAATRWHTPPFDDLRIDDAPEWSRWSEHYRLELEERLGTALSRAGNARRNPARGRGGIALLERAVEIQPHRLPHHVDLVEALLDVRDLDEAAARLGRARAQFEEGSSTETLARLQLRLEATAAGAHVPPGDPTLRLDFVGRSEEFGALLNRWRQACQGRPGIGLVVGDAGIGKTRLAEEIRLVAESEGGRVVAIKAEDSERPIEWGLLSELIQRLLRLSGAAGISPASDGVLRSLMPSLALSEQAAQEGPVRSMGFPVPRTTPSAALSDALVDLLTAVSEDAPLLLVIDDLHWADTESRTVLARAATRLDRALALLLFTCRIEGEEARIRKTLSLLSESPASTLVELAPWSLVVMERALRERLVFSRPEASGPILRRIHATSRGNPLFILELLKVFQDEGILALHPDGSWHFDTDRLPPDLPLPGSLRALVDRQLDQISREATLVAAHMARIGHATSPRVLGLQTGLGTSAVTNGIGELLARGLVRWVASDSLAFVHDELRAAVARRYQLHVGLTAGGGTQWSIFRTVVVASLGILLLGAALYTFTSPDPFGPGPWGGGVIELTAADGSRTLLRPRGGGGSQLDEADALPAWIARDQVRFTPTGDGSMVLQLGPPPAGDDGDAEEMARPESPGTPPLLGSFSVVPPHAQLAPDHRWVAVVLPGPPDTLRLLAEGGRQQMHELVLDQVLDLDWCGPRHLYLVVHGEGTPEVMAWTPGEGDPVPLALPSIVPGRALACSPNDRALLLSGARNGVPGLFLHDLAVGSTVALGHPGAPVPVALGWHGHAPPSVPERLTLDAPDTLEVGIGGQRIVDGLLVLSGGTRRREPLAWSSDDPGVASVGPGGRITAVGPGETVVRARWGAWLEAPLPVRVAAAVEVAPRGILLDEAVLPPGSGPRSLLPDPAPSFPIEEGGGFTLEFDFRVAGGSGSLEICLASEAAPAEAACFAYPAPGAGPDANRHLALAVGAGFPAVRTRAPEVLPPGEWVSVALMVDPEGWVRLFVEDRLRAESSLRLPRGVSERWIVRASGAAQTGEVGLRRLRAWEGERR